MKKIIFSFLFIVGGIVISRAQMVNPVPTRQQLQWGEMEFYFFIHFGPNTFTDLEWGKGTEREEVFNPTQLDCRQWCRVAKSAGAKGIIITAKHHDGFCLWPSKYSTHTIRESKWRGGKGDILKELSQACKEYGLKFGVYLSPWDRNHPLYGTPGYNDVYINMMKEIIKNYGPLFEFWWDGANGEGPNGKKQIYDWKRFEQTMRTNAPQTVVFSDIGPDIRWVGNEKGFAGDPNWALLDTAGFTRGAGAPSTDTLNHGNVYGKNWIPAECDVSIRPGWFYHQQEEDKVKTPEELFELYLKSVGRGANLLLNVPPDRRGLINEHDSASLVQFKKLQAENFSKNYVQSAPVHVSDSKIEVKLDGTNNIDCIVLQEEIQKGQQIVSFTITLMQNQKEIKKINGTTIGRMRILTFPATDADEFIINITESKARPSIKKIAVYKIDEKLIEK